MLQRGVRRLVCAIALVACGDRERAQTPPPPQPSALERAIARDLTARFGAALVVRCVTVYGFPRGCTATFGDGGKLAIKVRDAGRRLSWKVDGLVVSAQPIEDYVRGVLDDLGIAQVVSCGARVRLLAHGDRVECALASGGKAFVTIAADGALALELALDPAAARARTEEV